jgi:hypothetical protein
MNNIQAIVRSLITYALCIPLAIFVGYVLTDPMQRSTFITLSLVLGVLCTPLLLKFHYPLMLLIWNTTAVAFFIPGRPQLWFASTALSFAISFTQRILNKDIHMIRVPQLARPLIVLGLVVAVTAALRGGFGMLAFGGEVAGGKRYFYPLLAIIGYFAITARRIPQERANLYVALFFLGGASCMIGDLFPVLGNSLPFVFWLFPPYTLSQDGLAVGFSRLTGATAAGAAFFSFMMARYGIRGIFQAGKPLRLMLFLVFTILGMFGGFRSTVIYIAGIFFVQFFLEGMHRTRLFPILILIVAVAGALSFPLAKELPPTIQRSLAFLPLPIDPVIRQDAEGSSEWRLRIWKAVLPQVSQYLFLGKGLGMSREYLESSTQIGLDGISEDQGGAALAGDYHNGPLSLAITFGIWGVFAFIWFQVAAFRILHRNYRCGDPALKLVNSMLLASFIVKTLMFWLIVGGFYMDLLTFAGWLGLSVALNGGVARPATSVAKVGRLDRPAGLVL